MSLLRQTQNLAEFEVSWDGRHRNMDWDLFLEIDRIPAKRIGTLTHRERDVLVEHRRRLCACGRGVITGHRLACWRCVTRHR